MSKTDRTPTWLDLYERHIAAEPEPGTPEYEEAVREGCRAAAVRVTRMTQRAEVSE
jgi:hypothetical protein